MIRITCKQDGLWRAGIRHARGATEYPDDAFDEGQLALLVAEPLLTVEVVDDGPQPDPFSDPEITVLVAAIGEIPDDPRYWTGSGAPRTSAIEEVVGRPVSAVERDQAWARYQEAGRAGDDGGAD